MASSAGNELDTVLGVGEERYEKVLRWPPPPATSLALFWMSGRRDTITLQLNDVMTLRSNDYVVTMTAVTVVGTDHVETTTASKEENTAAPEAVNKRFLYLLLDIAFDRCIVSS